MHERTIEWQIEDADLQIGPDARFAHTDLSVTLRKYTNHGTQQPAFCGNSISGTIGLNSPAPAQMFYDDEGLPVSLDVVAENDDHKIKLDDVLVTTYPDGYVVEFVARDADKIEKESEPDYPESKKEALRLLAELQEVLQ